MIKTKLAKLLDDKGLTQTDLVNLTNLNKNTINRYYWNSWNRINRRDLNELCNFFSCEIGDILEFSKDEIRELK